jgi:serine protease Do
LKRKILWQDCPIWGSIRIIPCVADVKKSGRKGARQKKSPNLIVYLCRGTLLLTASSFVDGSPLLPIEVGMKLVRASRAGLMPVAMVCLGFTGLLVFGAAPPPSPEVAARLEALRKPVPENVQDLRIIQQTVKEVLKRVIPATVGLRIGASAGSGVIISEDGYVLTAGHVSGKPGQVCDVILADGKIVKGKTLGQNTAIDSGMVKITTPGKYPYVDMGQSKGLQKGQWTVAVGHPRGYIPERSPVVRVGRVIFSSNDVIRTDNALVGGDSGGPLFDTEGNVIGIHSRINLTMESNFHVPVETYRQTWDRLAKGESWGGGPFGIRLPPGNSKTGYMGVEFNGETDDLVITGVRKGQPAEQAGIQANDVIYDIDGTKLKVRSDLMAFMSKKKAGETIQVTVIRDGEKKTFSLKLIERPAE